MPRSASFACRIGALALILAPAAAVLPAATVNVAPTQMTFVQSPALIPPAQTISVTATESLPVSVATDSPLWISLTQTGSTTPAIITVRVDPTGLPTGTHTASIIVTAAGAENSPVTIPVTITVTWSLSSLVSTSQLTFYYTPGQTIPLGQTLGINGPPGSFTISATAEVGSWLAVATSSSTAPTTVSVLVDPTGLGPGTYRGFLTIHHFVALPFSQLVSVTLHVAGTGGVWVTTAPLSFSYRIGGAVPDRQTVAVSYFTWSGFTARAVSTGWLHVDPPESIAPATISVWVDPTGLSAGTYNGSIVLESPGSFQPAIVPVTLTVTGSPPLSVSPATLAFDAIAGGLLPPPQTFQVTCSLATAVRIEAALGSWLFVSPASATTPQTVTVSVNQLGLSPGTYRGSIVVSPTGAYATGGQLVSVTLTVRGGVPVSATPTQLRFEAAAPGLVPPPQSVVVTASIPMQVAVAVSGGWLQVTPMTATTPVSLGVSVNTAGLAAGNYTGAITIGSPGAIVAPATVGVTLAIAQPGPTIRSVSNGATLTTNFAPGSLLSVFGSQLGPDEPQTPHVGAGEPVECEMGGTKVLLNGFEAPLLYVHEDQVNAVVPQTLAGLTRLTLRVECHGKLSDPVELSLAEAAPVLFTLDSSGTGQGAILNEDGVLNGLYNPAGQGSIIVLFGSGGGLTESRSSGILETEASPLRNRVMAWVGGWQAEVLYAGQAPGMITGMMQINLRVPEKALSGRAVPVLVRVGDAYSQSGVTVAVK